MLNIKQFINKDIRETPFLLIGKGPSFSNIKNININNYKVITLNHTVDVIPNPWLASLIDINVIEQTKRLYTAKNILIPYYPHLSLEEDPSPPHINIEKFIKRYPILQKFNDENRLVCYDLSDAVGYRSDFVFDIGIFSGDTIFNALAALGAKSISSVGIDGGENYDSKFSYLNDISLLKNKQDSFDASIERIKQTEIKYNIKLNRL